MSSARQQISFYNEEDLKLDSKKLVFQSDFKHSTENWLEIRSVKGKEMVLFI